MTEKNRILVVSANPWTTSRILVDEEAREIFERLQEGPYRTRFEVYNHTATRPTDLQKLLLFHRPHVLHVSGHGNKKEQLIFGHASGRGKAVDREGLVELLALYRSHLRLVVLNACYTKVQARLISEVIDFAVGAGTRIGDKGAVAFAGAFYRGLGFGNSIENAFDSAKAELALTKMRGTKGYELFVREGVSELDPFPRFHSESEPRPQAINSGFIFKETEEHSEYEITEFSRSSSARFSRKRIWTKVIRKSAARRTFPARESRPTE